MFRRLDLLVTDILAGLLLLRHCQLAKEASILSEVVSYCSEVETWDLQYNFFGV